MDGSLVLILGVAALVALIMSFLLVKLLMGGGRSNMSGQLRNIVSSQRMAGAGGPEQDGMAREQRKSIHQTAEEAGKKKTVSSRLTLAKKLHYAGWRIPPLLFRICEIIISAIVFTIISLRFNVFMQAVSLTTGPIFMRWLLNRMMLRRFKAFDSDYPQMILSLVGLLKTGMNPMGALEAASSGLEEGSVVKHEIEMMIERLRFGVSEDKSIGSFGEDIYHPEIELFVQALLLSRRVGGNLSDTLERLAKQVRKRQYFRSSANAAVGMQRGSIWFIIAILCGLEAYIYVVYPQAILDAWKDEFGWQVWQSGILCVLLGIFWVRQVTKIRV